MAPAPELRWRLGAGQNGGSAPGIAIKYQMMITVIPFSASMLSLMLVLYLADHRSFDAYGRLRDVRRKA